VDIPLDQLIEGNNTFEGNSGGQICHDFDWGQWGWYAMIVRIYYDEAPFTVTWDTEFIPDQRKGSIRLLARIQDETGCWYVTQAVDNLSLEREDVSVKMYTAYDIPEKFWVRDGEKKGCKIRIDNLDRASEALFYHRTWNGGKEEAAVGIKDKPVTINKWSASAGGEEHFYALSGIKVPVGELLQGINNVWYESTTVHHGIEILWPGPAIIIRYEK